MRIFILGVGKSGTTALTYKVAEGLPNCRAFSGGHPRRRRGYENAVYKHTFEERKGKGFELYREHLARERYDKKIWIARDPRDSAVSRMLYRWHRGIGRHREQFEAHMEIVLRKEKDPRAIPFLEVCRQASHESWPTSAEAVLDEERQRCTRMAEFIATLDDSWHFFRFEDMVDGKFDGLNAYLGFAVGRETEVPEWTGKAKVVRKKAYGDWRHWYTPADVERYAPVQSPYLQAAGYDPADWRLADEPVIEPEFSSRYMTGLIERHKRERWRWITRLGKPAGMGD
jgi:hypothetical protein